MHAVGWRLGLRFGLFWVAGLFTAHATAARLTLAIADTPAFAPMHVAEARGYFAAEGLDLTILHCVNGRRCLQYLTDGEAHLAVVADLPMMLAAHAGKSFDIVATMASSSRENNLVVRSDRSIRTPDDLKGKRIGFVKGTSAHYFTDTFLIFHGLDASTVVMVPMDADKAVAQLVAGEVDAAGLYAPHGPQALAALGTRGTVLPSPKLYTVSFSIAARPEVADAELRKLLKATQRAIDFITAEPQKARVLLAERLKLDVRPLSKMLDDYDLRLTLSQSLLTTLEAESRWAQREGMVPAGAMPDYLSRMRVAPLQSLDRRAAAIVK